MSLDTLLWMSGVLSEGAVVGMCVRRRVFRDVPVFCSYIAWSLLVDVLVYIVRICAPARYYQVYFPEMIVDSVFQFAVLVELIWAVLRPIRVSLPRQSILVLGLLVALAGAAVWPIAGMTLPPGLWARATLCVHVEQTAAILRVLIFLALAGLSQLLSIGWRNRELQIATGLGFYSLCSLAASMMHTHQVQGAQYVLVDQILVASYVCSLFYWVFCFAQKEAERRPFTPQMQGILLAVAGSARATRAALSESTAAKARGRDE